MNLVLETMTSTMNSVKPPRMTALRDLHEAETSTFGILVGTILSARTRDEYTTKVVKELFAKYEDAGALARAEIRDVEQIIKPVGFYRVKSRNIVETARIIDSEYGGTVPDDLEELVKLPGVGRKTANCVLVYAFDKPAIPVDVHVHRIANRLGLVDSDTPEDTERALADLTPKKYWQHVNETFVMFGQNICKPTNPMCSVCQLQSGCSYYASAHLERGKIPRGGRRQQGAAGKRAEKVPKDRRRQTRLDGRGDDRAPCLAVDGGDT